MRPIHPDTVAQLAAEKRAARHAERLRLCVEQRILDGPEPLADDAASGRPGQAIELDIDPLVIEDGLPDDAAGEPLDDGADAGRTEALVELAPTDDPILGRQLQEVVIPPAGIAAKNLKARDPHRHTPASRKSRATIAAARLQRICRIAITPPSAARLICNNIGTKCLTCVAADRRYFSGNLPILTIILIGRQLC